MYTLDVEGTSFTYIRGLPRIEELAANHCDCLEEIVDLPKVTRINARHCTKLRLLNSLPNLTYLGVSDCKSLLEIKGVPDTMQDMNLVGCSKLQQTLRLNNDGTK